MYLVINKWVIAVTVSNFSGQYLRNHWTLDIGVLGYIVIVWPKEHSPEVRSFPSGTPCIYTYIHTSLNTNRIVIRERRNVNWNIAVEGTLCCTVKDTKHICVICDRWLNVFQHCVLLSKISSKAWCWIEWLRGWFHACYSRAFSIPYVIVIVVVVAVVVVVVFALADKCHCHATIDPSCLWAENSTLRTAGSSSTQVPK